MTSIISIMPCQVKGSFECGQPSTPKDEDLSKGPDVSRRPQERKILVQTVTDDRDLWRRGAKE